MPARRSFALLALGTAMLLLVPLAAMQFTDEVSWGVIDFLLAGAMIFSAGAAVLIAIRRCEKRAQRFFVVGLVALSFALLWAELAVGLLH